MWSRSALEALRDECFADDVDFDLSALAPLPEDAVRRYFESGGRLPLEECVRPIYEPPACSCAVSESEIAAAITRHGEVGLLLLTDLPPAPLAEIAELFDDFLQQSRGEPAAREYPPQLRHLAYKDPERGRNAASGEKKRMFDLSPARLRQLGPEEHLAPPPLRAIARFWQQVAGSVPKLLRALQLASGSAEMLEDDKMVDYFEKEHEAAPAQRCREHRDFGTLSLIFSHDAGLEALVHNEWRAIPPPPPGAAVLLFGWVAEIRSNGRLRACLHRVSDPPVGKAGHSPRRVSAVLFAAPQDIQQPLEPVVLEGEPRRYISGVSAEAQQMYAAGGQALQPFHAR
ncbi:hypothetical protein AB1Y20_005778 [Prymnesium parvum]|uniref:Isopenicillin N synthase-like Fe(2+) 2OG dioxygenase domain-containing protein n=1 Tax=Prymnesium parvum TaxID=97485 RepID=A0AB34J327_PRYPA